MADIQKLNVNNTTYDIAAKYVLGSNACSSPENALLRSGGGRANASPSGDTWLFIDNLGAMSTPWGIKHEQQDNLISFYGAGARTSYIDLSNGNVVCSTINGGSPITSNNISSQSVNYANSAGSVSSVPWSSITGKPSTYTPSEHGQHWINFSNRSLSNASWGKLTSSNGYTPIFWMDSINGGGVAFSDYNGQTFMQIDGDYFAQEGQYKVWHAGNLTKVSQLSNDVGYKTTDTNTWRPVTNTYTGSDQSTCVSQYGTNALYNALVNGYASSAGSASLLTKQGGTSTATSIWNPLTSYKKVWGQNFIDTSLTSDTGDILYYLRKNGSSTELCVCIDGDYYAMGGMSSPQKVLHAGNSSVSKSGQTLSVTINGVTQSLTNTDTNTDTWMGNGIWAPGTNVRLDASANSQEWSFDIYRNGCSSCYWHVWDSSLGSLLTVYPDSGNVTVLGKCTATGFYQSSDERRKTFHDPIKVDFDKLSKLRKNYFKFNDKDKLEIGVSAQEVQAIYPEIVSTDSDGYLSVAYDKLSVIALAAIDELKRENNDLKDQLKAIKNILKEKGIL